MELEFYNLWKNAGLKLNNETISNINGEIEANAYAVWDYPLPDTYTRLWNSMTWSGWVSSIDSGVNRILNKDKSTQFAFFIDYARGKYIESKQCALITLEAQFSKKAYSFGFSAGSPLRDKFTEM